jgi:hypothetical protein
MKPSSPLVLSMKSKRSGSPYPFQSWSSTKISKNPSLSGCSLEPSYHSIDSVNLQDEKPSVILGPMVEDRDDSSPPFYTSLNIHDKVLHNCLMDSGASHNLMPKTVMEELGLEIMKSYHDLYSFDSRRVQCLRVIKDLVVTLFQLP